MFLVNTSLDNQNFLRTMEVFVVVVIWLFFFRVIRAVWVEVRPPKRVPQAMGAPSETPSPASTAVPPRRDRGAKLKLKVVEPADKRGQTFTIAQEVTVGRASGCGVRVDDTFTSNLHARIYREESILWIEDLDSTNGTWVEGQRVTSPTRLGRGDLVQVGGTVFEVVK